MKSRVFLETGSHMFGYPARVGLVAALLVAVLGSLPQQPVHAGTIAVNTVDDEDNSDGDCSLREAVYAANNDVVRDGCIAGSGDDVIDLTAVAGTITLGGTELAISSNLTITGPGADQLTISGNSASRVFNIAGNVAVVISDVTIANGYSTGESAHGGGILNLGTLTINRCTFASNWTSQMGGGICSFYGMATVNSSTFYDNEAAFNCGGVCNGDGTLVVNNSTFSGNRASEGAFDNYGGGAICNMAEYGSAELTINNSTIAFNSAKWGGGISNRYGTMNVKNTIVAGNTVHAGGAGSQCSNSGTITSSYNLESSTDCGFTGTGDLQNTDPHIGLLGPNGGPTWTHALEAGSPAINAGSCTDTAGNPVTTDQRGVLRISPCDIGAYEYVVLRVYMPQVMRNSP
jgi:CSLREA domain-containing protein